MECGRYGTIQIRTFMIRAEDYSPPLDRALELIHTAKSSFVAVILCNPNSPTGQLVPRHQLLKFIDALTKMHVWTIVDESFIEFASEHSVLTELLTYPRLLVLRSFSKFYGLPVLRIGYLVGPSHIVERLRLCQPPWSVNALAQRGQLRHLRILIITARVWLLSQRNVRASVLHYGQSRGCECSHPPRIFCC